MKKISNILFLTASIFLLAFTFSKKPSLKKAKKTLQNFCSFIPSGNALVGKDTVSVQSFYVSKTEITNIQYQEFLYDLKKKGRIKDYEIAKIDSVKWHSPYGYNEKYSEYYHKHPAYHNYPVVNITKKGAELYCEWLSKKYDSLSNGELKIKFRLPKKAEWIRAARGDSHFAKYTWKNPYLRNSDGIFLANFARIGVESVHFNSEKKKYEVINIPVDGSMNSLLKTVDVTAPAESYWPNDFGLYNMNGNVGEMLDDKNEVIGGDWASPGYDVRIESVKKYTGASPKTGFRIVATVVE
ncbi:MAG: SUMF1/EgtB/PvdO family nonheme iron enzyme [Fluviicola sp.]|nr:SUMF1/EgtB/PvdO family nonheme iron enzyme [Fluviicola sp.]